MKRTSRHKSAEKKKNIKLRKKPEDITKIRELFERSKKTESNPEMKKIYQKRLESGRYRKEKR